MFASVNIFLVRANLFDPSKKINEFNFLEWNLSIIEHLIKYYAFPYVA